MNFRVFLVSIALLGSGLVSGAAHAALQGRDLNGSVDSFEAYYDTDLNVTWLADANYAKTSGYDLDGRMEWAQANVWVAALSFTDGVNVYDNWRLPSVKPINGVSFNYDFSGAYNGVADAGYNISAPGTAYAGGIGSEMAHLYYNTLNNKGYCPVSPNCAPAPQPGWGLINTAPFSNLQAGVYWSGTEYGALNLPGRSWNFYFNYGIQDAAPQYNYLYALAVSEGDIGVAMAVPEVDTWAMLLAGLAMTGVAVKRRRQM